jgi:hypothetical protein
MKKIILILMMVIFSFVLFSVKESNPFASFMGVKWGTNALEFKTNFKNKTTPFAEGFFIDNLVLGTITIGKIQFIFKNAGPEKNIRFEEKNYRQFVFDKVMMFSTPEQFEVLLDIFTIKHGAPTQANEGEIENETGAGFKQSEAFWGKGDRGIFLYKYADNMNEGKAFFVSLTEANKKKGI